MTIWERRPALGGHPGQPTRMWIAQLRYEPPERTCSLYWVDVARTSGTRGSTAGAAPPWTRCCGSLKRTRVESSSAETAAPGARWHIARLCHRWPGDSMRHEQDPEPCSPTARPLLRQRQLPLGSGRTRPPRSPQVFGGQVSPRFPASLERPVATQLDTMNGGRVSTKGLVGGTLGMK